MGLAASRHYGMVALRRWQHWAVQVSETIDALMAAATIEGEDERLAKIRGLVASDFIFVNPGYMTEGPEALSAAFGRLMAFLDSAVTVVRTCEVDFHHDHFRYTWARYDDDQIAMEGYDFGWVDDTGRLKRLVVFDHVLPPGLAGA